MELISIKDFNAKESLEHFDCGIHVLNIFLSEYALKNDINNIGKTFLLVEGEKVLGFFTLAAASISLESLPDNYKKLPKYPLPVIRIARLAVDSKYQHNHLGKLLLQHALSIIINISKKVGTYGIVVDAKETSKGFYENYGFIKIKSDLTYFLPLKTIVK